MGFNIPDIVHDTKLESEVHPSLTIHFHSVTDPRAGLRHKKVEEKWERQQELGGGNFSTVWFEKCIAGNGQGQVRAVKEIKRSADDIPSSELARELEAMGEFSQKRYRHCFVQSFGWYETQTRLFIAMEYLECGDLHRYLCHPIPEIEASSITYQLLEGLEFMHRAGFAHRDLKPKNILVQIPGPSWWVKLADFGVTKRIHESTGLTTAIGTEGFMAPEVTGVRPLEELITSANSYTFAVDIWSLGMIVWRMVSSKPGFPKPRDLVSYVLRTEPLSLESNIASIECEDFVKKTLAASASQRPTATEASEHSWVQLYGGQAVSSIPDVVIRNKTQPGPEIGKIKSPSLASWTTRSCTSMMVNTASVDKPVENIDPGVDYPNTGHHSTLKSNHDMANSNYEGGSRPAGDSVDASIDNFIRIAINFGSVSNPNHQSKFGGNANMEVAALEGHIDRVLTVAISSDSKLVASGSSDETVRVWAAATGKLVWIFTHGCSVRFVAFSRDTRLLASAARHNIKVWDLQAGKLVQKFKVRGDYIGALSFLSDSKILAGVARLDRFRTASKFASLHIFDRSTGDLIELTDERFRGNWAHGREYLCFSSDFGYLISTSEAYNVNIWNLTMKKVQTLEIDGRKVCSIALSNDSALLAIGLTSNAREPRETIGTIEIRDMVTLKRLQTLNIDRWPASKSGRAFTDSMVFINASELAICNAGSQEIFIWEIATGKMIQKLIGHHDAISSVVASDDGELIVSGSYDETAKIWKGLKFS